MSDKVDTPDPYIADDADKDEIEFTAHDVYDELVNPEEAGKIESTGFDQDELQKKWDHLVDLFDQLKNEAPSFSRVCGLFIGYINGNEIGIAVVYPDDSNGVPSHITREEDRDNLTAVKDSTPGIHSEYRAKGYIVPEHY